MKFKLNYYNIDSQIDGIIKSLAKESIMKSDTEFSNLKIVNQIKTNLQVRNNIKFTIQGVILPSKIMNIIINWDKNLKVITPKDFIFKQNIIY